MKNGFIVLKYIYYEIQKIKIYSIYFLCFCIACKTKKMYIDMHHFTSLPLRLIHCYSSIALEWKAYVKFTLG